MVCLTCRAADLIEMELLHGSGHLEPLDASIPWIARTNADVYILACLALLLLALLPFVMVAILGLILAGMFMKGRPYRCNQKA